MRSKANSSSQAALPATLAVLTCVLSVAASCGSDQVLTYDFEPIELSRAPTQPGGATVGGLLAKVTTAAGVLPMVVDTAYPLNSLARNGCPSTPGWTYTGDIELRADSDATPVRAWFRHVGLFDICPGSTGDSDHKAVGVMGGPLLANFAVGLTFPRDATEKATMTLWSGFPGSDDQLADNGYAPLHFVARGGTAAAPGTGEASLSLPNARIVLSACAAPRAFSVDDPLETCARGELAQKATGQNVLLAIGTGEGPLILSQSAWNRIANEQGIAGDAGTPGDLYTPFSTQATPARFTTIPRLALFQGTYDKSWNGACVELARARRIEWVIANQGDKDHPNPNVCYQPCDANGSQAVSTHAYIELGPALDVAVVSNDSDLIRSINADTPPNPQVDGIVGAATLAGTRLRLDYAAKPAARVIASCESGATDTSTMDASTTDTTTPAASTSREQCWTAPSCPPLSHAGQTHSCFGFKDRTLVKVCP